MKKSRIERSEVEDGEMGDRKWKRKKVRQLLASLHVLTSITIDFICAISIMTRKK